jgi:hypothetical protein
MTCADFLAGVSTEIGNLDALLPSLTRRLVHLLKLGIDPTASDHVQNTAGN